MGNHKRWRCGHYCWEWYHQARDWWSYAGCWEWTFFKIKGHGECTSKEERSNIE